MSGYSLNERNQNHVYDQAKHLRELGNSYKKRKTFKAATGWFYFNSEDLKINSDLKESNSK